MSEDEQELVAWQFAFVTKEIEIGLQESGDGPSCCSLKCNVLGEDHMTVEIYNGDEGKTVAIEELSMKAAKELRDFLIYALPP